MWCWCFPRSGLSANVCMCMLTHVYLFSMLDVCFASMSAYVAGEDAANDPVQVVDVYPPAVLRRHTLHPNEREEAHLGVSRLWQKSTVRTPHHRRVGLHATPNVNYQDDTTSLLKYPGCFQKRTYNLTHSQFISDLLAWRLWVSSFPKQWHEYKWRNKTQS